MGKEGKVGVWEGSEGRYIIIGSGNRCATTGWRIRETRHEGSGVEGWKVCRVAVRACVVGARTGANAPAW